MADRVVKDISEIESVVTGEIEQLVQNLALSIDAEIVVGTPVKTGTAMGSWMAGLGSPVAIVVEGLGTPDRTINASEASARAIKQAGNTIRRFRLGSFRNSIWLSNAVSYIEDLNAGTSRQAPAGFVDLSIQRVLSQSSIRKVI
jgi:hypothetical protein